MICWQHTRSIYATLLKKMLLCWDHLVKCVHTGSNTQWSNRASISIVACHVLNFCNDQWSFSQLVFNHHYIELFGDICANMLMTCCVGEFYFRLVDFRWIVAFSCWFMSCSVPDITVNWFWFQNIACCSNKSFSSF